MYSFIPEVDSVLNSVVFFFLSTYYLLKIYLLTVYLFSSTCLIFLSTFKLMCLFHLSIYINILFNFDCFYENNIIMKVFFSEVPPLLVTLF